MSNQSLSKEIKDFIENYIPSVGFVDVLFLFYLSPEKKWTSDEVNKELRTNSSTTSKILIF